MAESFVRLPQILGDKKLGFRGLVPVSKSHWYSGIKAGIYPAPVKLSPRVSLWRLSDIEKLITK
jgi:predicted DNA-binding transcriptional regulator AlpA